MVRKSIDNQNGSSGALDKCLELQRLFRLVQRQNRFISSAPATDLSLFESHILLELDAQGGLTVGALRRILACDQGYLSHTLSRLRRRGLVRSVSSKHDRRSNIVSNTASGAKLLREIDAYANTQIASSLRPLSAIQQRAIFSLYAALAEGLGASRTELRSGEHRLRPLQRRLARAFGVIGDSAFGSGMNSTSFHVFSLLADYPGALSPKAIAEALAIKKSNLSSILSSLQKRGLLEGAADKSDKRHILVSLNKDGAAYFKKVETAAAVRILKALPDVPVKNLDLFAGALAAYVSSGVSHAGAHDLTLRRIRGSAAARAFMVRNAVRLGLEDMLPPAICDDGTKNYLAVSGGKMMAAVQFSLKGLLASLDCFAWDPALDRSALRQAVLHSATRDLQQSGYNLSVRKEAVFLNAQHTGLRQDQVSSLPKGEAVPLRLPISGR